MNTWPENKADWRGAMVYAFRVCWPHGVLGAIVGPAVFLWTGKVFWLAASMGIIWLLGTIVALARVRKKLLT